MPGGAVTFETSDACPHGIRYLRGVNVCSVCLAQPGDRSGETPEQRDERRHREVLDALPTGRNNWSVGMPLPAMTMSTAGGGAAAAVKLGLLFSERGSKALAGDESAVRPFARRAARWSAARRARVAEKLAKQIKSLEAKHKKIRRRKIRIFLRKIPTKVLKKIAIRKLKLKVLYAIEHRSKLRKKKRVMADEPDSVPDEVEQRPDADQDDSSDTTDTPAEVAAAPAGLPIWVWLGAGGAVAVVAVAASRRRAS